MTTARTDHDIILLIKRYDVLEANKIFWNQKNLSSKCIIKSFMQFIVDFLHRRNYTITDEDLENMDNELASKIFNSDIFREKLPNTNYKQFITIFLNNAFVFNQLDKVLECTQQLTASFLLNPSIPAHDELREKFCLLTSYFLEPLADYWIKNNASTDMNLSDTLVELNVMVPHIIEIFANFTASGVIYRNICSNIVTEYCMVLEKNPQLFIKMLVVYKSFLGIDHSNVQTVTIKSLTYLCAYKAMKRDLLDIFYNKQEPLPISEMFHQISCRRQTYLQALAMLKLFIQIAELDRSRKMFSQTQRLNIYRSCIEFYHQHAATMKSLTKMMVYYEVCVLMAIIDVFNVPRANDAAMEKIISLLITSRDISIPIVAEFIANTNLDAPRSKRACQIFEFVYTTQHVIDEKFIENINEVMIKCIKNEQVFGTICAYLNSLPKEYFKKLLLNKPRIIAQIVEAAILAFRRIPKYPKVLAQILGLIKSFKSLLPVLSKAVLERAINHLYEELIEIDALEIAETDTKMCIETPLIKLTMMYEAEIAFLHDYFEYDALFVLNRRHLENRNDKYFAQFVRFQAVLLKFSFNLLVKKKRENKQVQFPLTLKDILTLASDLRDKLVPIVKGKELFANLYEAKQILTSLFQIIYDFHIRPIMLESAQSVLFIRQPKIEQTTFKAIIESIQSHILIYHVEKSNMLSLNDVNYSRGILLSLSEFLKNYSHRVDYTPIFKIIALLHDENLHNSIINILKFLQSKSGFVKLLGLSIVYFVIEEDRNNVFPAFATSLNDYLIEQDLEHLQFDVVEFILDNLPEILTKVSKSKNRLLILKNIQIFMPKVTKGDMLIVDYLVSMAIKDLQLKKTEKDTFVDFLKKYKIK